MEASYISNNSFSVVDDRTSDFIKGRRVKLDCASDGIKYASVVSSTFSSITTVVVNENVLTSNLITVLYSSVKPGQEGNLPNHMHSTFEGDGGYITPPIFEFTELNDTPSTYSGTEGFFAKSTGSGVAWEEVVFSGTGGTSNVQTFLDLEDTPDVYPPVGDYISIQVDGSTLIEPVVNFPLFIKLTTNAGLNSKDLTQFFDSMTMMELTDDFTGVDNSSLNSNLWIVDSSIGSDILTIQSNKLNVVGVVGNRTNLKSVFELVGDFDIQVDISVVNGPSTNSWSAGLRVYFQNDYTIYIDRAYNSGHIFRQVYCIGGSTVVTSVNTSISSSKLRLLRVGSSISTYYYNNLDWVQIGNSINIGSGEVVTGLTLDEWDNNPSWEINFDNFSVTSDEIIWEDKHPYAKKLALKDIYGNNFYMAIEKFDLHNKEVYLRAKVPIISTELVEYRLYYGSNLPDNVEYISFMYEYVDKGFQIETFTAPDNTQLNLYEWWVNRDLFNSGDFLEYSAVTIENNQLTIINSDAATTHHANVIPKAILTDDFDIQIDWSTDSDNEVGIYVWKELLSMDDRAYIRISNSNIYMNAEVGESWGTEITQPIINSYGKLRLIRTDSILEGQYIDGNGNWVVLGSFSWITLDCYIVLHAYWNNILGTTTFDNLTLNSGKLLEQGAYTRVWDDSYKAIYTFDQTPVQNTYSILDATTNGNHGFVEGGLDSDNIVDGFYSKAIRFDTIDEFIKIPDEVYTNVGSTVELLAKYTSGGSVILAKGGDGESIETNTLVTNWLNNSVAYYFEYGDGNDSYNGPFLLVGNPLDGTYHTLSSVIYNSGFAASIDGKTTEIKQIADGNTDSLASTTLGPNSAILDTTLLNNWEYRKSITISGSTGAGTGYQVLLKVGESSGASGYDFHVEGNADNFPDDKGHSGDLLFTADDSITLLPFWTEDVSGTAPNRVAIIWVKITSNLDTNKNIYCYYNNPNSLNVSNGKNTFDLFDDFTSLSYADQWTKDGSGTLNKGYGTLFTAGNGGQGLTTDGTYFYFGKDNGAGVSGTIYKYDFSGNLQTSFDCPPHAAGGSYRIDNDTIVFSSGGTDTPEVVELSKTGTQIQAWDFTGEGYNRGALVAYKDIDRIYLFTSDTSSNFKIQEYQINDDGTWNTVGIEYSHTSIGVPQGACYVNGYLYYLYDNGISKLQFNANGSITILETLSNLPGSEKEGLTHWGGSFYYGDSDKKIRIIYNEIIADFSTDTVYLTSKTAFGKNTAIKLHCRTSSSSLDYPMWGYRSADGKEYAAIGKIHGANNYLQTRTKTGGNQTESGNIYAAQQNWTHYEIARGASSVRYYVEGTLKRTETNNVPVGSITVKLGGTTHSESGNFRCDLVMVRNYIDIEPCFNMTGEQKVNPFYGLGRGPWFGDIEYIFISNTVRSPSWVKASDLAIRDSIIYYEFGRDIRYLSPNNTADSLVFKTISELKNDSFIDLVDTPSTYINTEGFFAKSTGSGIEFEEVSIDKSFTELIDTPSTYSGTEGLFAKSTGSGIEFEEVVFSGTGGTSNVQTFLDLEDTPDVYSEGKFIKATSSGFEFTNCNEVIGQTSIITSTGTITSGDTYLFKIDGVEYNYHISPTDDFLSLSTNLWWINNFIDGRYIDELHPGLRFKLIDAELTGDTYNYIRNKVVLVGDYSVTVYCEVINCTYNGSGIELKITDTSNNLKGYIKAGYESGNKFITSLGGGVTTSRSNTKVTLRFIRSGTTLYAQYSDGQTGYFNTLQSVSTDLVDSSTVIGFYCKQEVSSDQIAIVEKIIIDHSDGYDIYPSYTLPTTSGILSDMANDISYYNNLNTFSDSTSLTINGVNTFNITNLESSQDLSISTSYQYLGSIENFPDIPNNPGPGQLLYRNYTNTGYEWGNGVIVDNKDKVLLTLDVGEYWACDLNSNMFDVGVSVSGTKALFRFDNNLNDDCGNNIITNNNLKFGIGKFGNCLTFDSSSTANGSLPSSIFYENESFCISVWINIKNQSSIYRGVFGIRNDTNSDFYFLVVKNTNDIEVRVRTSGGLYGLNYSHTAYMNSWAHVVFQHNSTTAEIWVNGTLINSVAITGSFVENSTKFMIGVIDGADSYYCRDIDIDNLRILSSFLDEDAIISLYNEKILSHVDAATELANLITTSGIDITAFSMGYEVLVKSTIPSKISASGIVNIYTEHLIGDLTFSNLLDTPSVYTEGQYLRTTTSGIEAIDGIILKAPNQTEWLIGVTNSGILTTVEV